MFVFMFLHIRSPAEKHPGESWRLAVSPTPVHPPGPENRRSAPLTSMWTRKRPAGFVENPFGTEL